MESSYVRSKNSANIVMKVSAKEAVIVRRAALCVFPLMGGNVDGAALELRELQIFQRPFLSDGFGAPVRTCRI